MFPHGSAAGDHGAPRNLIRTRNWKQVPDRAWGGDMASRHGSLSSLFQVALHLPKQVPDRAWGGEQLGRHGEDLVLFQTLTRLISHSV